MVNVCASLIGIIKNGKYEKVINLFVFDHLYPCLE